jgi:hypothetical protein
VDCRFLKVCKKRDPIFRTRPIKSARGQKKKKGISRIDRRAEISLSQAQQSSTNMY